MIKMMIKQKIKQALNDMYHVDKKKLLIYLGRWQVGTPLYSFVIGTLILTYNTSFITAGGVMNHLNDFCK